MDAAQKQMLTDSIVDKIMLISRTADGLKARLGQVLSKDEQSQLDVELSTMRAYVRELSQLSALEEFDVAHISAVYDRLDAVVERADSVAA